MYVIEEERKRITNIHVARNFIFGWVVSGKLSPVQSSSAQVLHFILVDQLKNFWELLEVPHGKHMIPEEKASETFLEIQQMLLMNAL